jgi:hypothetical protein
VFILLHFCFCSEAEIKDSVSARKIQKADREKLRRDRLNEHFVELGNTLGKYSMLLYIVPIILMKVTCLFITGFIKSVSRLDTYFCQD